MAFRGLEVSYFRGLVKSPKLFAILTQKTFEETGRSDFFGILYFWDLFHSFTVTVAKFWVKISLNGRY